MSVLLNSRLINCRIPADAIYPENNYELLGIKELFGFVDGKRTDSIDGYAYEVVELKNYNKLLIKIEKNAKLLMSDDELQKLRGSGERVMVSFENLTILAYFNVKSNAIMDSYKADNITRIG